MKVEQFYNKYQFIIRNNGEIYFQSYNSVVAKCSNKTLIFGSDWDYSNTTRKHLYLWLDEVARYQVNIKVRDVINDLEYCKNKRARLQRAIDEGVILFDEDL